MAPGTLRESTQFPSRLAEPSSSVSGIIFPWDSALVDGDRIGNEGYIHNTGHGDNAHENMTDSDGTWNESLLDGHAGDLHKSGSVREVVLNGHVREIFLNGHRNDPQRSLQKLAPKLPGSFALPAHQHEPALQATSPPPPLPPPSPPLARDSKRRPSSSAARIARDCRTTGNVCVPVEHVDILDDLFMRGYNADVAIHTEDGGVIAAHSTILAAASPVLRRLLEEAISCPCGIPMNGVPYAAARVFVRFLYSSRYGEEEMEAFIFHLLVLAHAYCVPSLKRLCTHHWEQGLITHEKVIDILQIARLCDAPRLHLLCYRIVITAFKEVARTEGWKVMRKTSPELEQELVGAVIETDYRKQGKLRRMEDDKIYGQLHDAMEALVHICRDGCRTIGPHDKVFDITKQGSCQYPACKGLESLVRHFASCKLKVSGGCIHCKRMWQLLELHSRMCQEASCKVPLCGHFRTKIGQHQSKRYEIRWRLLVNKVISAKNASSAFSLPAMSARLEQVVQC